MPQHTQLNLPITFSQAIEMVKQLSPNEKQQLSEVLWTEQNLEEVAIPEEQKQMVRQRIKSRQNNPQSALSWDEIEQRLAARK